jgi:hypothetical protein
MALNPNQPTDQVPVSELPSYIRANRAEINSFVSGGSDVTITDLMVSAGDTVLVLGTDLTVIPIEVVKINSLGAATIDQITGGAEGQIKIFIFQGNNLSFRDGPKSNGQLYLNHLPALSDFSAQQDDVIALINIDGDGSAVDGYWKELYRTLSVK